MPKWGLLNGFIHVWVVDGVAGGATSTGTRKAALTKDSILRTEGLGRLKGLIN
jgi:hypothetical protein